MYQDWFVLASVDLSLFLTFDFRFNVLKWFNLNVETYEHLWTK